MEAMKLSGENERLAGDCQRFQLTLDDVLADARIAKEHTAKSTAAWNGVYFLCTHRIPISHLVISQKHYS